MADFAGERRGSGSGRGVGDAIDALKSDARLQAAVAGATARQIAGPLGEQMRQAAQSLLEEQKGRVAQAVEDIADVLRRTADALESEDRAATARYAEEAAAQIRRLSDALRNREIGELLAKAEDFARRQPALFIARAVAAGFVVGRMLVRPPEQRGRGYAMTGGERSYHSYAPAEEPLAGYGPIVTTAEGG